MILFILKCKRYVNNTCSGKQRKDLYITVLTDRLLINIQITKVQFRLTKGVGLVEIKQGVYLELVFHPNFDANSMIQQPLKFRFCIGHVIVKKSVYLENGRTLSHEYTPL